MKTTELEQLFKALQNDKKVHGICGLAEFLKCSRPTASKIASSGRFPRYQVPGTRQIFFYEREILQSISQ